MSEYASMNCRGVFSIVSAESFVCLKDGRWYILVVHWEYKDGRKRNAVKKKNSAVAFVPKGKQGEA